MSAVRLLIVGAVLFLSACGRDNVATSGTVVKECSNGFKIVQWEGSLYVQTLTSHRILPGASVQNACETIGSSSKI